MNLYEILQNSDRVGEGMTHFERLFAQKIGGGSAVITGVPPLRYIGDGRPLTDYMLYGNALQDGTPSPDAPVDATGCGAWDEAQQSYKLPLTVNGVEYPIYLGQVETMRRVKKLVLTGEELWNIYQNTYYITVSGYYRLHDVGHHLSVCSHFPIKQAVALPEMCYGLGGLIDERAHTAWNGNIVFNPSPMISSLADWKSYLREQYAAGTPVTVWYVLAEPETAVVNEQLMKIGDYADTVSAEQAGVTIPTVSGANVLDVPTEVPPSEVLIRGRIKEV